MEQASATALYARPVNRARDDRGGLLDRCVAGEADAWRALHETYHGVAGAFLRKLGVPDREAEDACQEVFVQVFRYLGRFERRADFKTWLYRLCITEARRVRRRSAVAGLLRWFSPPETAAMVTVAPGAASTDAEAWRVVKAALDGMKPAHRTAFVLYEMEGLSGEQIARIEGCPVATVWRRLHHARKEFEARLHGTDAQEEPAS